jgi:hypothetical protein
LSHAYASHNQIDEGVHQQLLKGLKLPFPLGFLILGRWIDIKRNFRNRVSFYYFETIQKSRNPGFAEEPKTTWFTVNPLTSLTVTTSPGLPGVQLKVLW